MQVLKLTYFYNYEKPLKQAECYCFLFKINNTVGGMIILIIRARMKIVTTVKYNIFQFIIHRILKCQVFFYYYLKIQDNITRVQKGK